MSQDMTNGTKTQGLISESWAERLIQTAQQQVLTTRCASTLAEVHAVLERVDAYLRAAETPLEWREDMNIILAEVLSNIARYAYDAKIGIIELEIRMSDAELQCRVSDSGRPFDPTLMGHSAPEPAQLREGGYGWFLIRNLARKLTYRRDLGVNCLTFWVPVVVDTSAATL